LTFFDLGVCAPAEVSRARRGSLNNACFEWGHPGALSTWNFVIAKRCGNTGVFQAFSKQYQPNTLALESFFVTNFSFSFCELTQIFSCQNFCRPAHPPKSTNFAKSLWRNEFLKGQTCFRVIVIIVVGGKVGIIFHT
jgi:hypothetical protein